MCLHRGISRNLRKTVGASSLPLKEVFSPHRWRPADPSFLTFLMGGSVALLLRSKQGSRKSYGECRWGLAMHGWS